MNNERKMIEQAVYETGLDVKRPSENLLEFSAWIGGIIASIPEELRPSAEIKLETEYGYEGDAYVGIRITHKRPETDAEMKMRKRIEEMQRKNQEAKDRAEYEALKKRFGGIGK